MFGKRNANTAYGSLRSVTHSRQQQLPRPNWLYWPLALFVLLSIVSQTLYPL